MGGKLNGKCLCGAVTVSAVPARDSLGVCHCDMCRAWTSSMYIEFEAATGTVEAEGPIKVYTSSDWAERAFCEVCGSALWYRITAPGPMHGQTQMSAGLFENAGGMTPKLEVFIDKKPQGYALEGGDTRRQMTEAEVIEAFAPKE